MNKSRRKVNRFVNWLFEQHEVQRIPVSLHWYNRVLVINDNKCFGLFMGNPDNEKEICIHSIAGTKYGTDATMTIIAHEFAHYLQYLNDRNRLDDNLEEMEEEAEAYGQELVQKFIDKRKARKRSE